MLVATDIWYIFLVDEADLPRHKNPAPRFVHAFTPLTFHIAQVHNHCRTVTFSSISDSLAV